LTNDSSLITAAAMQLMHVHGSVFQDTFLGFFQI